MSGLATVVRSTITASSVFVAVVVVKGILVHWKMLQKHCGCDIKEIRMLDLVAFEGFLMAM